MKWASGQPDNNPAKMSRQQTKIALRLHDRVLYLQVAIDRFIRRLRRGAAPAVTQRRFLIVQIDGLSRAVLDQGLASGNLPFLKKLLRRHGHRVQHRALPRAAWIGKIICAFEAE